MQTNNLQNITLWWTGMPSLAASLERSTTPTEWMFFGATMLLCIFISWGMNAYGIAALVRFLKNRGVAAADAIGKAAAVPIMAVVLVYFINLGLSFFDKLPKGVHQHLDGIVPVLYGISIFVFCQRLVDILVATLRQRWHQPGSRVDEAMLTLINRVLKGFVIISFGMVIMQQAGIHIMPLLTGFGFVGAAVALAAQSTIGNIIGSLEILADRLFTVGDRISFGGYEGFVTKMGLRSIELTSLYGERINLPNKDLVDKQIRNFSRGTLVQTIFEFGITYDNSRANIEKAMKLLEEIFASCKALPGVPTVDKATVTFKSLGDFSLVLRVVSWATYHDSVGYHALLNYIHLEVKEKFDAAGISFAFPTQTLHLAQGSVVDAAL